MSTEEEAIKAQIDKADAILKEALAKAKAAELSSTGWVKTHIAVVGAVVCFIIGFIAGKIT